METIKAVCECKKYSENYLVVGIPKKRGLAKWGEFMWFIQLGLIVLTSGVWLFFIVPYVAMGYFLDGEKYICQYCNQEIDKKDYR